MHRLQNISLGVGVWWVYLRQQLTESNYTATCAWSSLQYSCSCVLAAAFRESRSIRTHLPDRPPASQGGWEKDVSRSHERYKPAGSTAPPFIPPAKISKGRDYFSTLCDEILHSNTTVDVSCGLVGLISKLVAKKLQPYIYDLYM